MLSYFEAFKRLLQTRQKAARLSLTFKELLDVLLLAREWKAAQLHERVLVHGILALDAELELVGLGVED